MSRSGVGSQIGVVTEAEYGVFKAPERFYQFDTESLTLEKEYIRNQGLRNGRIVQAENLHRATTRTVTGDFSTKLFDQGMGLLFNLLHGNEVTPEKIEGEGKSGEVFKQVHAIGTTVPFGKSLTVQVGRDDTGGEERAFSYLGGKVVSLGVSLEAQGETMLTVSLDGQDEDTEEELAEPTYDAGTLPFTFQECELKLGGSKTTNARSTTLNLGLSLSTDRYHIGNSGLKDEPIVNGFSEMTMEAEMEFASMADHNRFTEENVVKAELICTGAAIGEEGETFLTKFTIPALKQVSSAPTVQGPDIITQGISFEVVDNGSEAPVTVEILSTDESL